MEEIGQGARLRPETGFEGMCGVATLVQGSWCTVTLADGSQTDWATVQSSGRTEVDFLLYAMQELSAELQALCAMMPLEMQSALATLRERVKQDKLPLLSLLTAEPLRMQSSHLSFQVCQGVHSGSVVTNSAAPNPGRPSAPSLLTSCFTLAGILRRTLAVPRGHAALGHTAMAMAGMVGECACARHRDGRIPRWPLSGRWLIRRGNGRGCMRATPGVRCRPGCGGGAPLRQRCQCQRHGSAR